MTTQPGKHDALTKKQRSLLAEITRIVELEGIEFQDIAKIDRE